MRLPHKAEISAPLRWKRTKGLSKARYALATKHGVPTAESQPEVSSRELVQRILILLSFDYHIADSSKGDTRPMAQGPILIFDKSTLESLNADEAVWLDNFFSTNITPLFFIETLADLEKQVRGGRTPEQVVGNLSYKTPDMQSSPNVHHQRLLEAELYGLETIPMDGRPIISGGSPVTLNGKTGIIFRRSKEEEALIRWQAHEFLALERLIAKSWRRSLSDVNYEKAYKFFQNWFPSGTKPRSLQQVKVLADDNIDGRDQGKTLEFGMILLGIPREARNQITARWQRAGEPAIRGFAPYFRYVLSVELFFYLAIASDLISRDRPTNKVDEGVPPVVEG